MILIHFGSSATLFRRMVTKENFQYKYPSILSDWEDRIGYPP